MEATSRSDLAGWQKGERASAEAGKGPTRLRNGRGQSLLCLLWCLLGAGGVAGERVLQKKGVERDPGVVAVSGMGVVPGKQVGYLERVASKGALRMDQSASAPSWEEMELVSAGASEVPSSSLAKVLGFGAVAALAIVLGCRGWRAHRNSNRASKGVPCPLEPLRSLLFVMTTCVDKCTSVSFGLLAITCLLAHFA